VSRFKVEILPEAESEFREAFLWYFERSPIFADAFRTEVLDKIDDFAERRRYVAKGRRRYSLPDSEQAHQVHGALRTRWKHSNRTGHSATAAATGVLAWPRLTRLLCSGA